MPIYRVTQKFGTIILYALTLPNINRFSKLFHYQNQEKLVIILPIIKDLTRPQVCLYSSLWNVKCLKSNNWKQDDFCNNTFQEINNRKRVYCLSYCLKYVTSCSFYIKCSMCPPCCWTTHSSRRRYWSRHWSVSSPAWVRRPAASRIHWTGVLSKMFITRTLAINVSIPNLTVAHLQQFRTPQLRIQRERPTDAGLTENKPSFIRNPHVISRQNPFAADALPKLVSMATSLRPAI